MNKEIDKVIQDVRDERERQDSKWGEQDHNFFVWLAILGEEKGEADRAAVEYHFQDGDTAQYREELIHTAAVAVAAVECYDRHHAIRAPRGPDVFSG